MEYLASSKEVTGYNVRIWNRPAFVIRGYTLIAVPGRRGDAQIGEFWNQVKSDGRLEKLQGTSAVPPWVLGLGSWDPECPKHGQRYTICIEETENTDFMALAREYPLFTKEIGASDWLCFELSQQQLDERFWKDNPYTIMQALGYQFNTRDFSVGLHFDAYPPDYDAETNPNLEFWITVVKA
jgi:predicted transcriptional regulator YdeE